MTDYLELKPKGKELARSRAYLTVAEGAVRSTKTTAANLNWLNYMITSPENTFLMSGSTASSVYRNCIQGDFGLEGLSAGQMVKRYDAKGYPYYDIFGKRMYVFGGGKANSFQMIRGMTIGGWYADEVDLHHLSFIDEALRRSAASRDNHNLWTLNAGNPRQPIYTQHIDRYAKNELMDYEYYHFTIHDNPAMTPKMIDIQKALYTGDPTGYARAIEGKRVVAEGLVYPLFANNIDTYTQPLSERDSGTYHIVSIGVDFGGARSHRAFVAWGITQGFKAIECIEVELYDSVDEDSESLKKSWVDFCKMVKAKHPSAQYTAYADSMETVLINSLIKTYNETGVPVAQSLKTPILERIRLFKALFAQHRITIYNHCQPVIDAFATAVWDESKDEDVRLDDGTSEIDQIDASEYAIEPFTDALIFTP